MHNKTKLPIALLNRRVTVAIHKAEQLEMDCRTAFAAVSRLEAELAELIPITKPEGRIARRVALHTCKKAGEPARRVIELWCKYYNESIKAGIQELWIKELIDSREPQIDILKFNL